MSKLAHHPIPTVTAEDLLAFHRCRRLPYLHRFGPSEVQHDPSDFLIQLHRDRQLLRDAVMQGSPGIVWDRDLPIDADNAAVLRPTLTSASAPIYRVRLQAALTDPVEYSLVSQPDALVWQPCQDSIGPLLSLSSMGPGLREVDTQPVLSREGAPASAPDGFWIPVEIRTGKGVKQEYELILAIHARLLGQIQGVTPTVGLVVLRDQRWHWVSLMRRQAQVEALITDYFTTLAGDLLPDVVMARSRCSLCTWKEHCHQLAQTQDPLSLVPGVTAHRYPALKQAGIESVEHLAYLSPLDLQGLIGVNPSIALKLVQQAQASAQQRPVWLTALQLPTPAVEIYFDVEAEPNQNLAYLLGALVVETASGSGTFHPFVARTSDSEAASWFAFLDLLACYPDAPVYHFHAFEVHTCRRLAAWYGTNGYSLDLLLRRFVDLHVLVTDHVALPVESYSLKHLAHWLGFHWRHVVTPTSNGLKTRSEAGGMQAIYWYGQWIATGEDVYLQAFVTYNEDDCWATYHLKTWMAAAAWAEVQVLPIASGGSQDDYGRIQ